MLESSFQMGHSPQFVIVGEGGLRILQDERHGIAAQLAAGVVEERRRQLRFRRWVELDERLVRQSARSAGMLGIAQEGEKWGRVDLAAGGLLLLNDRFERAAQPIGRQWRGVV